MDFLVLLSSLHLVLRARGAQPNVLLIMLDDMPFLDQWKESAPADLADVLDAQYPTPYIDAFRNEAVIFSKSYCGGPKCAPSRYSILTGRQPSRCDYISEYEELEHDGPSVAGPEVSIYSIKMNEVDGIHSIPYVLQNDVNTPYHTGMVGKWHLMERPEKELGCAKLNREPDADLYAECTNTVKTEMGFDFADAWFYANIVENEYFSHNPEWMVERSQAFIQEAQDLDKPFFLYFASTLAHAPSVAQALQEYDCSDTPKGKLLAYETPKDRTTMWPRMELWKWAQDQAWSDSEDVIRWYATYAWMDQMVGALFDVLTRLGVYDDTFIVLTNDHGMSGKGLLYQQGTRIFNFVRYPARFGKDGPMVLPSDFVVSNVDVAATVFDLTGVTPPAEYVTDGKSFLTDVTNAINHPGEFTQTSCVYKFIDMYQSHSIVMGNLQYIWRATDEIDTMDWGAQQPIDVYPNVYDMEQLYDLDADPSQQNNIFNDEQLMMDYAGDIAKLQTLMRKYVQDICQMDRQPCLMPEVMFTTSAPQLYNTAVTPAPTEPRCCYATDLNNKNAMKCYDIGDSEVECETKSSRWSCAYGQGSDVCAVPTTKPPEPGCCFGSNSKCTTDDEAQCLKFAARSGCEWRSGADADCTPTTPEPGCCFGSNTKCDTDDEAQCLKFAARAGCDWRSGDDPAMCEVPAPEPGCCFGSNSKCATDDETQCIKFAARAGCEWRSGADADCTTEPSEAGCCFGSNTKCDTDDEERCNKFSARAGCEWRTGDDANCAMVSNEQGVTEQVLSVLDSTTNTVQLNDTVNAVMGMMAVLLLSVSVIIVRMMCDAKVHEKEAVPSYGSTSCV